MPQQPSPPEKKSFWQRTSSSTSSSNHRSMLNENEPFSISRESFESYRRSFVRSSPNISQSLPLTKFIQDISARSPIRQHDSTTPRQSLDSRMARPPRSAIKSNQFERPEPTDEEAFEDVGLNDEAKQPQKKRGIFSRFGDNNENAATSDTSRPSSSHRGFHLPGRKRGQSGQGAELGNIDRPANEGIDDGVIR